MIQFSVERKSIQMTVGSQKSVTMTIASQKSIKMTVEKAVAIGISGRTYEGSYEVTPTVEGHTMETKEKYMKDDVTIHPIPYFSVGNNSGGNTVFIGSEVLIYGNQ